MSRDIFDRTVMGGIPMRNRLVRSATWEDLVDRDGRFDDRITRLYTDLAEGGVGLIVTGFTTVSDLDDDFSGMMRLSNDGLVPQFRGLVQAVKGFDCPIIPQLALSSYLGTGPDGRHRRIEITEMDENDLKDVVELFSEAASRARRAGFDGVQIHAAHGFFLSRCLSPFHNRRRDSYGGSVENRARILTDILDAISEDAGDLHMSMKINCDDFQAGGLTFPDCIAICKSAESHGIGSIEVSGNGTSRSGVRAHINEGYFQAYAAEVQGAVGVPVISVGGYRSPEHISKVLNETDLRYFSLSRPLIHEPGLPNRWRSGDLAPSSCISCNSCYRTPGHACIFEK